MKKNTSFLEIKERSLEVDIDKNTTYYELYNRCALYISTLVVLTKGFYQQL